ncbi:MAG: hypothetical protein M5U34_00925 [Chloroflexi bacterium]|nr:hypothetical protein [Chloroflexota bacterium]
MLAQSLQYVYGYTDTCHFVVCCISVDFNPLDLIHDPWDAGGLKIGILVDSFSDCRGNSCMVARKKEK